MSTMHILAIAFQEARTLTPTQLCDTISQSVNQTGDGMLRLGLLIYHIITKILSKSR